MVWSIGIVWTGFTWCDWIGSFCMAFETKFLSGMMFWSSTLVKQLDNWLLAIYLSLNNTKRCGNMQMMGTNIHCMDAANLTWFATGLWICIMMETWTNNTKQMRQPTGLDGKNQKMSTVQTWSIQQHNGGMETMEIAITRIKMWQQHWKAPATWLHFQSHHKHQCIILSMSQSMKQFAHEFALHVKWCKGKHFQPCKEWPLKHFDVCFLCKWGWKESAESEHWWPKSHCTVLEKLSQNNTN